MKNNRLVNRVHGWNQKVEYAAMGCQSVNTTYTCTPGGLAASTPVSSLTKEVNPRLAKRILKMNGLLAHLELTTLVKETIGHRGPKVKKQVSSENAWCEPWYEIFVCCFLLCIYIKICIWFDLQEESGELAKKSNHRAVAVVIKALL